MFCYLGLGFVGLGLGFMFSMFTIYGLAFRV